MENKKWRLVGHQSREGSLQKIAFCWSTIAGLHISLSPRCTAVSYTVTRGEISKIHLESGTREVERIRRYRLKGNGILRDTHFTVENKNYSIDIVRRAFACPNSGDLFPPEYLGPNIARHSLKVAVHFVPRRFACPQVKTKCLSWNYYKTSNDPSIIMQSPFP